MTHYLDANVNLSRAWGRTAALIMGGRTSSEDHTPRLLRAAVTSRHLRFEVVIEIVRLYTRRVLPRAPHPFPARMSSAIPWDMLKRTRARTLTVLDPMMGSGTVPAAARELGHRAIGFDTDPLAVMMTRVWCETIDHGAVRERTRLVLGRARKRAPELPLRDAYPAGAGDETRRFVRYWFDATNRRQLAALAKAITGVRDAGVRDVLWCGFSRLIITKQASASRAMDVAHSRPHLVDYRDPIRPFDSFQAAVERVLAAREALTLSGPVPRVGSGDARELPLDDETVDVAITSPPYLNAIDYLRGHKFTLVWMGHDVTDLRALRASNIGTEVSSSAILDEPVVAGVLSRLRCEKELPPREWKMFARYLNDMHGVLAELHRVLVDDGRAILVLGNNTVRGVFVRNSRAITLLATSLGFKLIREHSRPLPPNRRYLPPPTAGAEMQLGARMREEVILSLRK